MVVQAGTKKMADNTAGLPARITYSMGRVPTPQTGVSSPFTVLGDPLLFHISVLVRNALIPRSRGYFHDLRHYENSSSNAGIMTTGIRGITCSSLSDWDTVRRNDFFCRFYKKNERRTSPDILLFFTVNPYGRGGG
jgi:hypothetical protein